MPNKAVTGDSFTDRLAEAGATTGRPELAHQSLGRVLTDTESALSAALTEIYGQSVFDPADVAAALNDRGIVAPISGSVNWTPDLLEQELKAINKSLDDAYEVAGYGA